MFQVSAHPVGTPDNNPRPLSVLFVEREAPETIRTCSRLSYTTRLLTSSRSLMLAPRSSKVVHVRTQRLAEGTGDCQRAVSSRMASEDPRNRWTVFHFSQGQPLGIGQGDVAALLRRVADSLDELGDVQVLDLTFKTEVTEGEDDLTVTVYYERMSRRQ